MIARQDVPEGMLEAQSKPALFLPNKGGTCANGGPDAAMGGMWRSLDHGSQLVGALAVTRGRDAPAPARGAGRRR